MNRVYAIVTNTTENGHNVAGCAGTVGVYSSKKKAVEALNRQRELARSNNAELLIDEPFEFWYRYDERKEITYQYYLNWYELNDMSLTQWDRVLPRIKE